MASVEPYASETNLPVVGFTVNVPQFPVIGRVIGVQTVPLSEYMASVEL